MGWMEMMLLGDVGNQLDIEASKKRIEGLATQSRASNQDRRALEHQVAHLEKELAQVRLAAQGLTRFLVEKGIVKEGELVDFVREVDAEDGVIDGQLRVDPQSRKLQLKLGGLPAGLKRTLD